MTHLINPQRTKECRTPLPESVGKLGDLTLRLNGERVRVERWSYCGADLTKPENEWTAACCAGDEIPFSEMCGDCLGLLDAIRHDQDLPPLWVKRMKEKDHQHEVILAGCVAYEETRLIVSFKCETCDRDEWGPFALEREDLPPGTGIDARPNHMRPDDIQINVDPHYKRRVYEHGKPLMVIPDEWPWALPMSMVVDLSKLHPSKPWDVIVEQAHQRVRARRLLVTLGDEGCSQVRLHNVAAVVTCMSYIRRCNVAGSIAAEVDTLDTPSGRKLRDLMFSSEKGLIPAVHLSIDGSTLARFSIAVVEQETP